jgi:hypothetical protein
MINSLADKLSLTQNNQSVTANNLLFTNPITTPNVLLRNNDNTTTSLNSQLATIPTKADLTYTNTQLNLKANSVDVTNNLNAKADLSYTNAQLNLKANTTDLNLKQNISDMTNYFTKTQSDARYISPTTNTEQNVPYLSTSALKTSTNESVSTIIHTDVNLDFSYFNLLTFYSPVLVAGNKISVEILGGAPAYLGNNINEPDKLIIDIVVLDNNPSFPNLANVVCTHYFIGSNELNTNWCDDVVLTRNTETGFTTGFSWNLLCRLSIGTYPVFVKCSNGVTVRHNNINMGYTDPTQNVVQNRWFRSVNRFGVRSESVFTGRVVMNNFANSVRFVDKVGCYLLNGTIASASFNKYPIFCSERDIGSNMHDLSDAFVLMSGYAVVLYTGLGYTGTSYPMTNSVNSPQPLFVDLNNMANTGDIFNNVPTNSGNRDATNIISSVRLYTFNSTTNNWTEVTINGIS